MTRPLERVPVTSNQRPERHCINVLPQCNSNLFIQLRMRPNGLSKSLKNGGLFPPVFNVATKADIQVNATCGEDGPEQFCKPSESLRCAICDSRSPDPNKRHRINLALDSNPGHWWQSPTLARGDHNEYVTIILDLKQYQKVGFPKILIYVFIQLVHHRRKKNKKKTSTSNWTFRRSQNTHFLSSKMIEFSKNDYSIKTRAVQVRRVICFGILHTAAIRGDRASSSAPFLAPLVCDLLARLLLVMKPILSSTQLVAFVPTVHTYITIHNEQEREIRATARLSRIIGYLPFARESKPVGDTRDNLYLPCAALIYIAVRLCTGCLKGKVMHVSRSNCGIHTQLLNGRPGALNHSDAIEEFTRARYVRLRLQSLRRRGETIVDKRRAFYSIREINIGGRCLCSGHASRCKSNELRKIAGQCECKPGFSGPKCDRCASGYRQFPDCVPCPCDSRGILPTHDCEGDCLCKARVHGEYCDRCKPGYFALARQIDEGCLTCVCSAVSSDSKKLVRLAGDGRERLASHGAEPAGRRRLAQVRVLRGRVPSPVLARAQTLLRKPAVLLREQSNFLGALDRHARGQQRQCDDRAGCHTYHLRAQHCGCQVRSLRPRVLRRCNQRNPRRLQERVPVILLAVLHICVIQKLDSARARACSMVGTARYASKATGTSRLDASNATVELEPSMDNAIVELDCALAIQARRAPNAIAARWTILDYLSMVVQRRAATSARRRARDDIMKEPQLRLNWFFPVNTYHPRDVIVASDTQSFGIFSDRRIDRRVKGRNTAVRIRHEEVRQFRQHQKSFQPYGEDIGRYVQEYKPRYIQHVRGELQAPPPKPAREQQQQVLGLDRPCPLQCAFAYDEHRETPRPSLCGRRRDPPQAQLPKYRYPPDPRAPIRWPGRKRPLYKHILCWGIHKKFYLHLGSEKLESFRARRIYHPRRSRGKIYILLQLNCKSIGAERGINLNKAMSSKSKMKRSQIRVSPAEPSVHRKTYQSHRPHRESPYLKKKVTGQCHCKPGVGGSRCDVCLPGHYGFSHLGCQACEPCNRPGHICNPLNGRCTCPALSLGEQCDRCRPGSFGLRPGIGCQACACSTAGSIKLHCSQIDGQCPCREGFASRQCKQCAPGYYDYPRCKPCNCDPDGSLGQCDASGQCPCKENVKGRKCNECVKGTFGLSQNNSRGCTECFCFGRSNTCRQAELSWGQKRLPRPRVLYVNDTVNEVVISNYDSSIVLPHYNSGLNKSNSLYVVPGTDGDVTLPMNFYREYPVYWQLPSTFLGDKVASYGGYLRFTTITDGGYVLREGYKFPQVQLHGNGVVLEHYLSNTYNDSCYLVKFDESVWQLKSRPETKVTRQVLMVALQNVQQIFVKASDFTDFPRATLMEASIDIASLSGIRSAPVASSVEHCECPSEYNGTSCQDPSSGYYRWREFNITSIRGNDYNELIGRAKKCRCNNRSDVCDIETGHCLNCRDNTAGRNCEICAESYFGDPNYGGCHACPCPQRDKKFSNTCILRTDNQVVCVCKPGYAGNRCERCAYGHFGYPSRPGGSCEPCRCNAAGSASDECDTETGQCNCRPGSTGRDCSQCEEKRKVYVGLQCMFAEAQSTIKMLDAKVTSLTSASDKRQGKFDKWNSTLATKLQILKDKIAEARNTADGIRVSIRSAEGKKCVRSYRAADLQPSSTTTIVMTLAIPESQREGLLFYLASSINDDYVAIEMYDRKIRFVWNVGGGTGVITHPQILNAGSLTDETMWYRIEAERIRHLGKLSVSKQLSRSNNYLPVVNMTSSEFGLLDVTSLDRIWIGGIPELQFKPASLIAPVGLPACVHQVVLDGKPIGLWNFLSNAPDNACRPCTEGVEYMSSDVSYSFNGKGYAVRSRVNSGPYNKYTFGVSISFRSYDEDALLFLAIDLDNPESHIVIFLSEGHVVLQIAYGGGVVMKMTSSLQYNSGNWTKVDAFRQYQPRTGMEKCSFSVNGESDKKIGEPTPRQEDIPDLSNAKFFIGGVPPSFRVDNFTLPTRVSFLGCISNILVQEGYDPMSEQYYGVEPGCKINKPVTVVGFYGNGFVELAGRDLRKKTSSLGFSFRTLQDYALLLLSTFEGPEERLFGIPKQDTTLIVSYYSGIFTRNVIQFKNQFYLQKDNYYSVAVIDGHIEVRVNNGKGEAVLQSNGTFNDGKYHTVIVNKKRKEIELRIDDAYQMSEKLLIPDAVRAPKSGGLFFGGLPQSIMSTKKISTKTALQGAIKDVIYNDDSILNFGDAVSFEHAFIGRPGPTMGKDSSMYTQSASLARGLSTQPEGCRKVPYYSLEPGALKFGDKANSHTQLYLNFEDFWLQKKKIEFDFRTYYPDGLLFITPGVRLKNYLAVVIRDGQLSLVIKSKQKKEILFKTPFNDGNWHHVTIGHGGRKLTMIVDAQTPMTIKVPKKIGLTNVMYIGGIPESGTPLPDSVVAKLQTLKGCIRGLKVNGNVYDMVGSTSRPYNVGQCFPNVESGAYFHDEAYAVYKKNFKLDVILELQLEIRTSELSGVLLFISGSEGSPSLSLELHEGKVVMSSDTGDNQVLQVEQNFLNPYTICDNRWHKIQAVYNDGELTLRVDELDEKYGLPIKTDSPFAASSITGSLYIGGLPVSAPKASTPLTRDHFNGCMRNIMIGGERRDWTDMSELHNIHLNTCPVQ
ncbi:unnamed protein product [Trichogramma brassicae]|uniref:Laminin subunit alpha-1 n=1 Tax=Trichogramma brassicae TaxID=86971 RepID=A0A6H5I670_9HYME|nr:unnamed protein product [Trichogramma brassicae]